MTGLPHPVNLGIVNGLGAAFDTSSGRSCIGFSESFSDPETVADLDGYRSGTWTWAKLTGDGDFSVSDGRVVTDDDALYSITSPVEVAAGFTEAVVGGDDSLFGKSVILGFRNADTTSEFITISNDGSDVWQVITDDGTFDLSRSIEAGLEGESSVVRVAVYSDGTAKVQVNSDTLFSGSSSITPGDPIEVLIGWGGGAGDYMVTSNLLTACHPAITSRVSDTPGPDRDNFDGFGPLVGTRTLERGLPWTVDSYGTVPFELEDGAVGFGTTGGNVQRAMWVEAGMSLPDTHYIEAVIANPEDENMDFGLFLAGRDIDDTPADSLSFLHAESFGNLWVLSHSSTNVILSAEAVTAGDVIQFEVGSTYWVGVNLTTGTQFGPFAIPSGYTGYDKQGLQLNQLVPAHMFDSVSVNTGSPMVLNRRSMASTSFTGSTAVVDGTLTDQRHAWVSSNSSLKINGSGSLFYDGAAGFLLQSVMTQVPVQRDVDITVVGNVGSADNSSGFGPLALWTTSSQTGGSGIYAKVMGDGELHLIKSIANTKTTLATESGFTITGERTIRMVIRWPVVELYYEGSGSPDLTYTLTGTDQSDLSAGAGRYFGVALDKNVSQTSPSATSFDMKSTAPAVEPTEILIQSDSYSGNTYITNTTGSQIRSDGTKQAIVIPILVSGDIVWRVALHDVGSETFAFTDISAEGIGFGSWDNHNALAVAIDDDGRIHAVGNMHDFSTDPNYVMSDPAYDTGTWTEVSFEDLGAAEFISGTPRQTYPQLVTSETGDVIYTVRDKVQYTARSNQYAFRWETAGDEFIPLDGGSGRIIRGTIGVNNSQRGVYLGNCGATGPGGDYFAWTWACKVGWGEGDFDVQDGGRVFSDVIFIKTEDGGDTFLDVEGNELDSPVTYLDNPVALDTGSLLPTGMDNTMYVAQEQLSPYNPHILSHMDTPENADVEGLDTWNHTYWDDAAEEWVTIHPDGIWRKRQLALVPAVNTAADTSYIFGVGRPTGEDRVVLYQMTPGHMDYGGEIITISTRPMTNGWAPSWDWYRLRNQGILSMIIAPSYSDGPEGPNASVPAYVAELDLTAVADTL